MSDAQRAAREGETMGNDLTKLEHLNEDVPVSAAWWECPTCGDYAWLWPGETPPACQCDEEDEE